MGTEQLAISQLGAILRRQGHTVGLAFARRLFDDCEHLHAPALARFFPDDLVGQGVRFRPDVVCVSALTVTYRTLLEAARAIRDATGATTLFGGVHPSAVPGRVLDDEGVDYVCVGEGDRALPALLGQLAHGPLTAPLPGIAFRRDGELVRGPPQPFVQDLDSLPGFEKDLWVDHLHVGDWYMTMSSRGCPYRCTFCFNNFFASLGGPGDDGKAYLRRRSVDHFLAELVDAKRRYNPRYIEILDDIFTLDTPWLQEFARRYRAEVGIPFSCLSHAHFLDEARARALADAGCQWVQIGIQSLDDEYKKDSLRRREAQHRLETILDQLHRVGVRVKTDHIFGFPGERMASQDVALDFYPKQPGIRHISTYWLNYFPGTEIVDEAREHGLLSDADVDAIESGNGAFFDSGHEIADPQRKRAYQEYELLFRLIPHLPARFRARLRREHVSWLPGPALGPLGTGATVAALALTRNPDLEAFLRRYARGIGAYARGRVAERRHGPMTPRALAPIPDTALDRLVGA